jgi:hypothetical protein
LCSSLWLLIVVAPKSKCPRESDYAPCYPWWANHPISRGCQWFLHPNFLKKFLWFRTCW